MSTEAASVPFDFTVADSCQDNCFQSYAICQSIHLSNSQVGKLTPLACRQRLIACLQGCETEMSMEAAVPFDFTVADCQATCMQSYVTCRSIHLSHSQLGKMSPVACRQRLIDCLRACESDLVGTAPQNPEMSMEAAFPFDFTVADSCPDICFQSYSTCQSLHLSNSQVGKMTPLACRQRLIDCLRACESDLVGTAPQNPEMSMEAAFPFDFTVADSCPDTCFQSYKTCSINLHYQLTSRQNESVGLQGGFYRLPQSVRE